MIVVGSTSEKLVLIRCNQLGCFGEYAARDYLDAKGWWLLHLGEVHPNVVGIRRRRAA